MILEETEAAKNDKKDIDISHTETPEKQKHTLAEEVRQLIGSEQEDEIVLSEELKLFVNDLTEYKGKSQTKNVELMQALSSEPELADIMRMVANGASFREALARVMDLDELTPNEDDPDYEAWTKAKEERIKTMTNLEIEKEEIKNNYKISQDLIIAFIKDKNMNDDDAGEFVSKIVGIISDSLNGKYPNELMDAVYKSMKLEDIVEQVKEDTAVEIRNNGINQFKAKKEEINLPEINPSVSEQKEEKSIEKQIRMMPFGNTLLDNKNKNKS